MTNLQLLLTVGIPSFLVLIGILLNHREVSSLKTDMKERLDRVDARLVLIESDQKQFFAITGKLDGRIEELHRK